MLADGGDAEQVAGGPDLPATKHLATTSFVNAQGHCSLLFNPSPRAFLRVNCRTVGQQFPAQLWSRDMPSCQRRRMPASREKRARASPKCLQLCCQRPKGTRPPPTASWIPNQTISATQGGSPSKRCRSACVSGARTGPPLGRDCRSASKADGENHVVVASEALPRDESRQRSRSLR